MGDAASAKFVYIASAVLITTLIGLAFLLPATPVEPTLRVAFIGNSVTFVNDLPRFVQALDGNNLFQDSCLHGALNFMSLLYKGNGMRKTWQTKRARINQTELYDWGACSVPQLLSGHDPQFYLENSGKYSDGKNPCTENADYLAYRESLHGQNELVTWDFVVMNDQSRYPVLYRRRRHSLLALRQVYAPLLRSAHATVVFLVTYGYVAQIPSYVDDDQGGWKYTPTETEEDMPYFTASLYYGYQEYRQALERRGVPVRLAQVGLAFLTVWEENRELWRRLFFVDGLHPSPLGTFLEGCVVHATIRQRLPPVSIRVEQVSQLWNRARRMNLGRSSYSKYLTDEEAMEQIPLTLPTRQEAHYLSDVCRRVALKGYQPSSLLQKYDLDSQYYSSYADADDGVLYGQFLYGDDDAAYAQYNYDDYVSAYADRHNDDDAWFWCSGDDDGGFWCA